MSYEDKNKCEVLYVKLSAGQKGERLKAKAESFLVIMILVMYSERHYR